MPSIYLPEIPSISLEFPLKSCEFIARLCPWDALIILKIPLHASVHGLQLERLAIEQEEHRAALGPAQLSVTDPNSVLSGTCDLLLVEWSLTMINQFPTDRNGLGGCLQS